jgi:AraC-like DNA-binding protein
MEEVYESRDHYSYRKGNSMADGDADILESRDLDETSTFLHQNSGPYKYELQEHTNLFVARLEFKKLQDMTVSYGWFGSAITVSLKPDAPYYSLFSRLYGSSEYTVGNRVFITSPSCGAFLPGTVPLRVRTQDRWQLFGTNFLPSAIQRELSHLLGSDIVRPIEFNPVVNFDYGAGRLLKRMLMRLYKDVAQPETESHNTGIRIRQVERSIITLILEGLEHSYSRMANAPGRKIAPRQLRNVEEFIRQYADEPLSLGDLSVVGGVSARSLQYTFLRHRGCSPMAFLRLVRFERVRDELLRGNESTTVTAAALRWGFSHLGRFAAEYRARFKESPSETVRRARGALFLE